MINHNTTERVHVQSQAFFHSGRIYIIDRLISNLKLLRLIKVIGWCRKYSKFIDINWCGHFCATNICI